MNSLRQEIPSADCRICLSSSHSTYSTVIILFGMQENIQRLSVCNKSDVSWEESCDTASHTVSLCLLPVSTLQHLWAQSSSIKKLCSQFTLGELVCTELSPSQQFWDELEIWTRVSCCRLSAVNIQLVQVVVNVTSTQFHSDVTDSWHSIWTLTDSDISDCWNFFPNLHPSVTSQQDVNFPWNVEIISKASSPFHASTCWQNILCTYLQSFSQFLRSDKLYLSVITNKIRFYSSLCNFRDNSVLFQVRFQLSLKQFNQSHNCGTVQGL